MHEFVVMWRLRQNDFVDRLVLWVQAPDGQEVLLAWLSRGGSIQDERRLSPFVSPYMYRVQPDIREIIDGVKAEEISAVRIRIRWCFYTSTQYQTTP
jgi:DNA polymerase IIIc chi subunit